MQRVSEKPHTYRLNGRGVEHLDPLLDCLVIVTRLLGHPVSTEALKQGLPLQQNRLNAPLFIRAAEQTGFSARLIKTQLHEISPLVTPVVLLLKDGRACVLTAIDRGRKKARIIQPESGEGTRDVTFVQLEHEYAGHAFFIREQYRYDERAEANLEVRSRHWFWGTLFRSWRIYRDVLLASALINLFAVVSPLFVMNVYDRVVPNNAIDTLWVLAIGALVVFSFDTVLKLLRSHFIDLAGKKSDIILSSRIFSRVMGMTMANRPQSVGAFARKLQDFESIREFITSSTVTALVDLPFALLLLMVMGFIGGPLIVVPLTGMALIALYGLIIQRPLAKTIDNTVRASGQKNAMLIESLSGLESIRAARAEGELQGRWEKSVGHIARWSARSKLLTASTGVVVGFVQQLVTVALIVAGVYLIMKGELSMGGLIASVMLAGRCLTPMAQIASLSTRYNQARAALTELNNVMQQPLEKSEEKQFVHRERLQGQIAFTHVSFQYPKQHGKALDDVSFSISPGEKVGIIGRSGSGKTTLNRLLLGLYQSASGVVRFDGLDSRQIDPSDLRRNIGTLLQDSSLFYGRVRDNITMGAGFVEDAALLGAAEIAGVMDFVRHHPEGLDMPVGERGANLSGGQRQCVALARALITDPPILLLDEPCTTLDNTSEYLVRQRLKQYILSKTLIMVTHKGTMLELVDRLIVLDHGKVIADGPKQQVLQSLAASVPPAAQEVRS